MQNQTDEKKLNEYLELSLKDKKDLIQRLVQEYTILHLLLEDPKLIEQHKKLITVQKNLRKILIINLLAERLLAKEDSEMLINPEKIVKLLMSFNPEEEAKKEAELLRQFAQSL